MDQGKIRHIGLSNETPWGCDAISGLAGGRISRMVTIQNSYNFLNQTALTGGFPRFVTRKGIRLLAYSPLAFGRLSGKYRGKKPEGARLSIWERFARYNGPNSDAAIEEYARIADEAGSILRR